MTDPEEMMHEIGGFEPADVKKVLAALEAEGIRFEIEPDHSDLHRAGRTLELALGMYPPGSKLLVFVPESAVERAQQIIARLFPT